ncbi:RecQ mediated genome instability protein-like protein Rmi1 [Dendryphion nanum]|uniref:RecQ-mediated genome instability protein 1 n=1 Tax=Dendryphion nanum TaxID=256645 RepID=A0A9P9EJJ7_9PLEO|nr:RecQ mediated genome instability protein-like protein Rmi1 [Dendryphion nanum]
MSSNLLAELNKYFHGRHLHPSPAWLQSFISGARTNMPLPALQKTALFRLLATDITTSMIPPSTSLLPDNILNGTLPSRSVTGPIVCQVFDIEDIGHSRWSQVETIEAKERGETTKGREIIRVTSEEEGNGATAHTSAAESKGPFKLLLQDAKGLKIYAYDLHGIEGLNNNMAIGIKLTLKSLEVRRGVIMLDPAHTQVLGGKIEALDKAWKDGKKERFLAAAREGRVDGDA